MKTLNGKYLLKAQVVFDSSEVINVCDGLLNDLRTDGHAIFDLRDFPRTLALNPELSETTTRDALFERFLSRDFSLHGNILVAGGTTADTEDLLKRFCFLHDELTINELSDRAGKLGINRQLTIIDIANELMIRVSKNIFVRDRYLEFNTSKIDAVLDFFVQRKIISLHDITDFSRFTPVKDVRGGEWEWNLYLLESFLRKVSRRYTLYISSAPNLVNGAICPRGEPFLNYIDLMSTVVVQEDIPLNTKAIDDFLLSRNFLVCRGSRLSTSIIKRAQVLRRRVAV